jgi:hypothetical protein
MATFSIENERDNHIRPRSCVLRNPIPFDGVTRAQKAQLRQRASPRLSLTEQWFAIFDILFPDFEPKPQSAYRDAKLSVDLEAFQCFANVEGPGIISAAIVRRGILLPNPENEERDRLAALHLAIEDGLHTITENWAAGMVSEPTVPSLALNHIPGAMNDSQPSITSSETLHDHFLEQYTAEESQSQQAQLGEHDEVEENPDPGRSQPTSLPPYDVYTSPPQLENTTGQDTP